VREVEAWCAPCRMRLALPLDQALADLMLAPERPFEPVTLAAGLCSADGLAHSIRAIPTGAGAREPGAYIEFEAEHEPRWIHRVWVPVSSFE
jgi:hypothetical protein